MNALTCPDVRDAAAEFALDILEPAERAAIAAHLLRCPECRREVDAMAAVGSRLVELVPGTEPPLGFDRRVLARVNHRQRRPRVLARRPRLFAVVASAAAAAALVFGSMGWFAARSTGHSPRHAVLAGEFRQGGHTVGEVYAYAGNPPWVEMTLHSTAGSEKVTCQLIGPHGVVTTLGSFDLVGGSGSWGAPDRSGVAGVSAARLVASDGQVLATAVFRT